MPVRRISVVGITGSGKTYLARRLSSQLGLPLIELDRLRESAAPETDLTDERFCEAVKAAVASDSWIIDGHYREIRHLVWNEADLVIHLDYPLSVILRQLLKRYVAKHARRFVPWQAGTASGHSPADGAGARESASWRKRLRRLAKTLSERRQYTKMLEKLDNTGARVKRFANKEAAEAWIQSL